VGIAHPPSRRPVPGDDDDDDDDDDDALELSFEKLTRFF